MQYITGNPDFQKLYETNLWVLGHVFEDAWLFNEVEKKGTFLGHFYGDPTCGLVSANNDWAIVGGEFLVIWRKDKGLFELKDEEIAAIEKVRLISEYEVEILIDPWSTNGAVWQLNTLTLKRHKIRDFKCPNNYDVVFDW